MIDTPSASYDEVLKQAQDLGYAERNPEADVEGGDACRKIAILTSIVYGKHLDYTKIHTEGITKISTEDFKYADALGVSQILCLLQHFIIRCTFLIHLGQDIICCSV